MRIFTLITLAFFASLSINAQEATSKATGAGNIDWLISTVGDPAESNGAAIQLKGSLGSSVGGSLNLYAGDGSGGNGNINLFAGKFNFKTLYNGQIPTVTFVEDVPQFPLRFGIGTTNPTMKLELGNLADFDGIKFGSKFKIRQSQVNDNNFVMENIAPNGNLYLRSRTGGNTTGNLLLNDQGGNVGIGTTTPGAKLDVNGNIKVQGAIGINTGVNGNFAIGSVLAIGDSDTGFKQQGDGRLAVFTNNVERVRFGAGGNVGIGTTNPSARLEVKDGDIHVNKETSDGDYRIRFRGNSASFGYDSDGTTIGQYGAYIATSDVSKSFFIAPANVTQFAFRSNGNMGVGTIYPSAKLQVQGSIGINTGVNGNFATGSVLAIGDSDTGFKQQGDGNLAVYTNNVERVRFAPTGNVGIGTTAPSSKLHVNGNVRVGDGDWGALTIDGKDKNDWVFNAHNNGQSLFIRTQNDEQAPTANIVMSMNRLTGNVGIGTLTPGAKLEIIGDQGVGKSVSIDSGELKFRGDGIAHFSIFSNRINNLLTIENTSSDHRMNTAGNSLFVI